MQYYGLSYHKTHALLCRLSSNINTQQRPDVDSLTKAQILTMHVHHTTLVHYQSSTNQQITQNNLCIVSRLKEALTLSATSRI